MGGDEFFLVITHVEKRYIEVTINRLREEWAACEFEFGDKRVSLTASFGIAGFCGKGAPTFPALVAQADKALYAAKRTGGNRVEVTSPPKSPPSSPNPNQPRRLLRTDSTATPAVGCRTLSLSRVRVKIRPDRG